jgi:peptidylprolyl isomerase
LRKIFSAIAASALVVTMAGCSNINSVAAMYDTLKPVCGDVTSETSGTRPVDSITVGTEKGEPTYDFAAPLTGDKIESKVITQGTGPKITGNQSVEMEFVGINGGTGKKFQASAFDGSDAATQYLTPEMAPPFCTALGGVREGGRVAILMPAKDAHNSQGIEQLGIGANDSVIFIFDIRKVYLPYAVGNEKGQQSGFPSVVRAANGTPGITINSKATPPSVEKGVGSTIALETLIEGAGTVVSKGDTVTLHYSGYVWADGTKFDSSWDAKQPATFTFSDGALIQGFLDGVIGQKVGSQIVVVIPPSLGYKDVAQGSIPANSTLVFVIDILGIKGK